MKTMMEMPQCQEAKLAGWTVERFTWGPGEEKPEKSECLNSLETQSAESRAGIQKERRRNGMQVKDSASVIDGQIPPVFSETSTLKSQGFGKPLSTRTLVKLPKSEDKEKTLK